MKWSPASVLSSIARGTLYALLFLIPIFFLPISLDPLEVNKQTVLVIGSLFALLCWLGSMALERHLTFRRGWLNALPVLCLLAAALSAAFSQSPYLSWVGPSLQAYASVISILGYAIVFLLCAHLLTTTASQRAAFLSLIASGVIASVVGLLSLSGAYLLPWDFTHVSTFNTVGSVNALGIYVATVLVIANAVWVTHHAKSTLLFGGVKGVMARVLILTLCVLGFALLAMIDFTIIWVVLLLGLGTLFAFALARPKACDAPVRFLLPSAIVALSLLFLFLLPNPFPVVTPGEVGPSHAETWSVAWESLGGYRWVTGTGPGTFLFDWSVHASPRINETAFWDTRFDRGSSHVMTVLATQGLVGSGALLLLAISLLWAGAWVLARAKEREDWMSTFAALGGFVVLAIASGFYASNLTLQFLFFALGGIIAGQAMPARAKESFERAKGSAVAVSLGFVIVALGMTTLMFMAGQRLAAEATFAEAVRLDRMNGDLDEVILGLDRAATLNQFEDVYARTLAQALLLKIGEQTALMTPGAAVPERTQQALLALTRASIDAVSRATSLAPKDAVNWTVRGQVYRELLPLVNQAGDQAVSAFEQVVALQPNHPSSWTELGKTHLAVALDTLRLASANGATPNEEGQAKAGELLRKAEEALGRAIQLKPDYAPAHFQLALVYEAEGRLPEAIGKMESVATYNPLDVGVAFELGLLYMRRDEGDDLERAQAQFESAIKLAPSYSNAHWFLSTVYEKQGKIAEAIAEVETVLALNPEDPNVQQRLEQLKAKAP